jgi:hypothetical protein
VLGTILTAGGLLLLAAAVAGWLRDSTPEWYAQVVTLFAGLACGALGARLLVIAARGRYRGRLQRWLSVMFDAASSV